MDRLQKGYIYIYIYGCNCKQGGKVQNCLCKVLRFLVELAAAEILHLHHFKLILFSRQTTREGKTVESCFKEEIEK